MVSGDMHVYECLCFTEEIFAFCNQATLTSAECAAGFSVPKAWTPLCPTFQTVAVGSKLFRYWVGVHLWCKEVVNLLKAILCWIQEEGYHLVCGINCSEDM